MKKITLIFTLLSFCIIGNAQLKVEDYIKNKKTEKEQTYEEKTLYIYAPDEKLVLEASRTKKDGHSTLRFVKPQKWKKSQLFVFSKLYGDWDIIYNLETKDYLVKNGNQIGLGSFSNKEKMKVINGVFYIEQLGQEKKLRIDGSNKYNISDPRTTLAIDPSTSKKINISNRFELYNKNDFYRLLSTKKQRKVRKSSSIPDSKPKPKPLIINPTCTNGKNPKNVRYAFFSAGVAYVSSKGDIELTINNKSQPFEFSNNKVYAGKIPLSSGKNIIRFKIKNESGYNNIERIVYYKAPPQYGFLSVKLDLKQKNKCGDAIYYVELTDKTTEQVYRINLNNSCSAYERKFPVGEYNVSFLSLPKDDGKNKSKDWWYDSSKSDNAAEAGTLFNTSCTSSKRIGIGSNNINCVKN